MLQSLEAKASPVHMRVLQVFGAKAWRIKALPAAPGKFSIGSARNRFTPLLVVDVDKPARGGARQIIWRCYFPSTLTPARGRPHFFHFFNLLDLPGIKALKAVLPSGVIRYFQPPAPSGFRSIQPFPSIMKIVDAPAGYSCAAGNQPAPNKAWSALRSRYVGIWPARPGIMSWT